MTKHRTIFTLAISILTMILSIGALTFFYKVIENKNKHTEAVTNTLHEKTAAKANSVALEEESKNVEGIHKTINSYFLDPAKIDTFVNYLEGLGTNAGAEVKVENFDTSSKKNLIVRITTKGTFSNVMRVLLLVENAPYKTHIISTTFNRSNIEAPAVVATDKATSTPITPTKSSEQWAGNITFSIALSL